MKTKNFASTRKITLGIAALLLVLSLGGCSKPSQVAPTATQDPAQFATQAVQTILAEFTQQAAQSGAQATWTPTLETAGEGDQPAATATQAPLPTDLPPTATLVPPTPIIPSLTPVPVVCNRAQFVGDITVQDQAPFAPEAAFTKIWRVKNTGSCTWTKDYRLVLVSGSALGAKQAVALPNKVEPNETTDLVVPMQSPAKLGSYRGDWLLSAPDGTRFGVGPNGASSVYVAIRVMKLGNPALAYDFAAKVCKAQWQSGTGLLPCPGTSSGTQGFSILLDEPRLENRQENELTLWTQPNQAARGWISGTYPAYEILPGQHFIAWVGCLDESKGCNVVFRLDFLNTKNNAVKNLGTWSEVYDGKITKIDLDLSSQAGKTVKFILTVEVAGGDPAKANAFWFVPGIIQGSLPTTTAVPTPTATATATETSAAYP